MSVPFIIVVAAGWFATGVSVYLSREVGKLRKLLEQAYAVASSQHLIITAMLRKGIEVRCDWCGNPMAPNVPIEVIEQDDGSVWVQHQSHGH